MMHLRRSREQFAEKITTAPPPEQRVDPAHSAPTRATAPPAQESFSPSKPDRAFAPAFALQRSPLAKRTTVPPLMSEAPFGFLLSPTAPPPPRASTPNTTAAVSYLQTLLSDSITQQHRAHYVPPVADSDYQDAVSAQLSAHRSNAPLQLDLDNVHEHNSRVEQSYMTSQPPRNSNPDMQSKRDAFWAKAIQSSSATEHANLGSGIAPTDAIADESRVARERAEKLERQREYVADLQQQLAQKQDRQRQERLRLQEAERSKDEEMRNYNPFGRAGAGAPLRDAEGRVITQLTELRHKAQSAAPVSPTQWHSPPASLRSPRNRSNVSPGGPSNGGPISPGGGGFGGSFESPQRERPAQSSYSPYSPYSPSTTSPRSPSRPHVTRFGGSITRLHENTTTAELDQRERSKIQLQNDLAEQVREKQDRARRAKEEEVLLQERENRKLDEYYKSAPSPRRPKKFSNPFGAEPAHQHPVSVSGSGGMVAHSPRQSSEHHVPRSRREGRDEPSGDDSDGGDRRNKPKRRVEFAAAPAGPSNPAVAGTRPRGVPPLRSPSNYEAPALNASASLPSLSTALFPDLPSNEPEELVSGAGTGFASLQTAPLAPSIYYPTVSSSLTPGLIIPLNQDDITRSTHGAVASGASFLHQTSFVNARNAWLRAWERTIDDEADDDEDDMLSAPLSSSTPSTRRSSGGRDTFALDERIGQTASELIEIGSSAMHYSSARPRPAPEAPSFDQTLASDSVFVLAEVQADLAMMKLAATSSPTNSAAQSSSNTPAPQTDSVANENSVPASTADDMPSSTNQTRPDSADPMITSAPAMTHESNALNGTPMLPPWTPQLQSTSMLDFHTPTLPAGSNSHMPEVRPFSALFAAAASGDAALDVKPSNTRTSSLPQQQTQHRSSSWLAAVGGAVMGTGQTHQPMSYAQMMSGGSGNANYSNGRDPERPVFTPPPQVRSSSAARTLVTPVPLVASGVASGFVFHDGDAVQVPTQPTLGAPGNGDAMDAFLRDFARGASVLN